MHSLHIIYLSSSMTILHKKMFAFTTCQWGSFSYLILIMCYFRMNHCSNNDFSVKTKKLRDALQGWRGANQLHSFENIYHLSQYLSISLNISQILSRSLNIYQYQSISQNIYQFLSISLNISQYLLISLNIC